MGREKREGKGYYGWGGMGWVTLERAAPGDIDICPSHCPTATGGERKKENAAKYTG